MRFIHLPNTQWYAYLRIITSWAANNLVGIFKELVKPLLYYRLAVTSRYPYNRYIKLNAVKGCQSLQCHQAVLNQDDVRLVKIRNIHFIAHHKISYTPLIEFVQKQASAPAGTGQCKK